MAAVDPGAAGAGEAPAGAAAAREDDIVLPPTIRDVFYPGGRGAGRRQVGGRLVLPDDEAVVEQAVSPNEQTWAGLRQHLAAIATDAARAENVKKEVLFRLAKGEERIDQEGRIGLDKYIEAIRPDLNSRGEAGSTALMYAAANDRLQHVKTLLVRGADPNLQNEAGETALMWAAAYGAMSPINMFRGLRGVQDPIPVNFDIVDNLGWNALMVAAWCGNYGVVKMLAGRTSRTHTDGWGRTAAALARDPASPATLRTTPQDNVIEKVLDELSTRSHPRQGGRRTYRSKTKDKKRGTR